jgi:hypothetical protein
MRATETAGKGRVPAANEDPTKELAGKNHAKAPSKSQSDGNAAITEGIYHKFPDYWILNGSGEYEQIGRSDLRSIVKDRYFARFGQPGFPDQINTIVTSIALNRSIDYALPKLPGYPAGLHIINDTKILVPEALKLIQPVQGNADMIEKILVNMLGVEQLTYFKAWLGLAYDCLKNNVCMPGQVTILAGPKGCGKNLVQEQIITPILGNRIAEPYRYIVGKTPFNQDHFKACHLMISDQKNPTNRADMQEFIRRIASNDFDSLHPKGKEAITLDIFWRMTVSCNLEEKDLRIVPPLEGLDDKILLFKCDLCPMPMPTGTPVEREKFKVAIRAGLPAFLYNVLSFKVPADLRHERFGVKGYMHPELAKTVRDLEPEQELLELVTDYKAAVPTLVLADITAAELHATLYERQHLRDQLRSIAQSPRSLGKLLGKLADRNDGIVTLRWVRGLRIWTMNV